MLEELIDKELLEKIGLSVEEESAGPFLNVIHLELYNSSISQVVNLVLLERIVDKENIKYYAGKFIGDFRKIPDVETHMKFTSKVLDIENDRNEVKSNELSGYVLSTLYNSGYKEKLRALE